MDTSDDLTGLRQGCIYAGGTRTPCETSANCGEGEYCAVAANTEGEGLFVCVEERESGQETGEVCDPSLPCRAGACIDSWFDVFRDYCTALCASDADCPDELSRMRSRRGTLNIEVTICLEDGDPRGEPL